jgi:hypothetical protein
MCDCLFEYSQFEFYERRYSIVMCQQLRIQQPTKSEINFRCLRRFGRKSLPKLREGILVGTLTKDKLKAIRDQLDAKER